MNVNRNRLPMLQDAIKDRIANALNLENVRKKSLIPRNCIEKTASCYTFTLFCPAFALEERDFERLSRQKHAPDRSGCHRQGRNVPHAPDDRVRDERRWRRYAWK